MRENYMKPVLAKVKVTDYLNRGLIAFSKSYQNALCYLLGFIISLNKHIIQRISSNISSNSLNISKIVSYEHEIAVKQRIVQIAQNLIKLSLNMGHEALTPNDCYYLGALAFEKNFSSELYDNIQDILNKYPSIETHYAIQNYFIYYLIVHIQKYTYSIFKCALDANPNNYIFKQVESLLTNNFL